MIYILRISDFLDNMFFNDKAKKSIVFYRNEDWKEDVIKDYLYHNEKSTLIRSENKIETIIDVNRKESFIFFLLNSENLENFAESSYIKTSVHYVYLQEKIDYFLRILDVINLTPFCSWRVIHNYQGLKIEEGQSYDIKDYYELRRRRKGYPFI